MPSQPPIYLMDSSGVVWLIWVANNGQFQSTPTTLVTAPTFFLLLDSLTPQAWSVGVLPNGMLSQPIATALPTTLNSLLIFAPNGGGWLIQIFDGVLTTTATSSGIPCTTPIATLANNVLARLEEQPPTPIFWKLRTEIYDFLVEAMNDMILLLGRPTQVVSQPITLNPNSVWQNIPQGVFLISNLYGPQGEVRRTNLFAQDYVMPGRGTPTWENETAPYPYRWGSLGFNMFFVHPAPETAIQLTMTGIQYPVTQSTWPPTGAEIIPFHHELFVCAEMYATHVARLKELGAEMQEGMTLYEQYLSLMRRFTEIEDRRDPVLFSRVLGAQATVSPITKR
jgi:hypothetical protein